MNKPTVAVVSAFEGQLQPVVAASAAGALRHAGALVTGWDADVHPADDPGADFDLVLISIPSFEAVEAGAELVTRFRQAGARHVLACGQYAWLNASTFTALADGVVIDEPEGMADELIRYASGEVAAKDITGLLTAGGKWSKPKARTARQWHLPARDVFRDILNYPAHYTKFGMVGNIEATRGCHHQCAYCAVYASYGVAAIPIAADVVVADAHQLAGAGATHFTFVDAEFFNTRKHALNITREIAAQIGPVTFEMTTRFDHILEFEAEIAEMAELGLRVIVSALEFPSDRVLKILDKGIDVSGIKKAIRVAHAIGIELRPTFITFTPWVSADEIESVGEFIAENDLTGVVDPTGLQTRLLLYKGSPLLGSPWLDGITLIDRGFYYDWIHPDPTVDELWEERRRQAVDVGATRCCVRC